MTQDVLEETYLGPLYDMEEEHWLSVGLYHQFSTTGGHVFRIRDIESGKILRETRGMDHGSVMFTILKGWEERGKVPV